MSTENPTPYWIRACTSTVPATSSPPVTPDAMRPEYDIRGGVRGKYARRYHRHPPKGGGAGVRSCPRCTTPMRPVEWQCPECGPEP